MTAPSSQWEQLAAHEGGTVSGLAVATAADGSSRLFAATTVGVFWSADGGAHWQPLAQGGAVAGAEVVAPSPRYAEDGVLFVGGHDGLFLWREAQPGWDHLLSGSRVLALAVLPGEADGEGGRADTEPSAVTDVTLLAGTEEDGILISRDGGRTWVGANPGLLDLAILALAASPAFHRDGLAFAATPTGLYRTRNGAASWRALELDDDEVTVQCVAVSPAFAADRVLLAGTEEHGLLRSDDGGRSWEAVPDLAGLSINAVQFLTSGGAGRRAIAATDAGVVLSEDGGATWRAAGAASGPTLSVAVVPASSAEALMAGLPEDGIVCSLDGGKTWAPSNAGLTASLLVGLACAPGFSEDQTLYAVSVQRGVSVSRDGGHTWAPANTGLGDLAVSQVVAARRVDGACVLYAATATGLYISHDRAASWQPAFPPALPDGDGMPVLALAAAAGAVLVAHSDGLSLSTDAGATWTPLAVPFGDARVVALAPSPTFDRDGILYAATSGARRSDGTADFTLWCFGRPGARWERLLDERSAAPVQLAVVADGSTGGTVLVGLGARLLRPRANAVEIRGGVRRPVWDATELPAALAGLATSPAGASGQLVYAATSRGIFRSRDGGATFAAWGEGLGQVGMVAVVLSPGGGHADGGGLAFALGLGGTIWRRRTE